MFLKQDSRPLTLQSNTNRRPHPRHSRPTRRVHVILPEWSFCWSFLPCPSRAGARSFHCSFLPCSLGGGSGHPSWLVIPLVLPAWSFWVEGLGHLSDRGQGGVDPVPIWLWRSGQEAQGPTLPPPNPLWTDKHLWKHTFPHATCVASKNNVVFQNILQHI